MSIRPQDLPELRAELIAYTDSRQSVTEWAVRTFPPASVVHDEDGTLLVCDPPPEQRRAAEVGRLKTAELYFVSGAMGQLADAAGESLPAFRVNEQDLPSPSGLMIFEDPLSGTVIEQDGIESHIQAVSWSIARNENLGPSLWLSFYTNLDHTRHEIETRYGQILGGIPKLCHSCECEWSFNSAHRPGSHDALDIWGRTVVATWLLMRQPLADQSDEEPDRAVRKRLRRAGHEPSKVRVIELRRPKSTGGAGDGESNYHHQWIVRGHWRQHWYPKRQVHRPVWIAPHIKGPEGAPLIGGEKVYALKR